MILHIPHASRLISREERGSLLPDDAALGRELLVSTDAFTDELFNSSGARRVVFPVSRLVIDPERFVDDAAEPMALKGRGVIYTRTADGKPLRHPPTHEERERLLKTYYYPHHRLLEDAVREELLNESRALIVDCHSYPSFPTLADQYADAPVRPSFCLGTDYYHKPARLVNRARKYLESCGFDIGINVPFSGSIVPSYFHRKDQRVQSIMVEVRRDLYLDETTGNKNGQFAAIKEHISGLLENLIADL